MCLVGSVASSGVGSLIGILSNFSNNNNNNNIKLSESFNDKFPSCMYL